MVRWFDNDREVESDYEVGNMDATATLVLLANMTDNGATFRCLVSNKASPDPQEKKIKLNVNFAQILLFALSDLTMQHVFDLTKFDNYLIILEYQNL